jgi:hypothetical protein
MATIKKVERKPPDGVKQLSLSDLKGFIEEALREGASGNEPPKILSGWNGGIRRISLEFEVI